MGRVFSYGLSVLSLFAGLFLSIRLNSFLFQWTGNSYNAWVHLVITVLFFIVALLMRKRLAAFLTENAYGAKPFAIVIYVLSMIISYFMRYPLLYRSIKGTDVNSPLILAAAVIGCGVFLGVFLLLLCRAFQTCVPAAWRCIRELRLHDWLYLAAVLVVLNAVVWVYMSMSQTVYFWDTAGYWETTHFLVDITRNEGIFSLMKAVYSSIDATDYNYIIALPGTFLCMLFGKSRYVFIAGIISVYLFPLYALLYTYIRRRWKRPMFITSVLVLFFPGIFYNSLVGFVDVAGVIPCLLAVFFYFRGDKKKGIGDYLITGCLLALAVLLRRWYAFFAVSFALAALVDSIVFRKSLKPILSVGGMLGFILLFFFQLFVSKRLLADYGSMYAAYQMGLKSDFQIYDYYYGGIIVAVLLVMAIYLIVRRDTRQQSVFLLIQWVSCFVCFTMIQSHGQQHLYLYVPAMLWFGARFFALLIGRERKPWPLFAVGLVVAVIPTVYCLLPRTEKSVSDTAAALPAMVFKPEQRSDIDDLLKLTEYLDSLAEGTDKRVALLSSSFTLNYNTLTNLEISLNLEVADDVDRSYLLILPAVDSRDTLPLDVDGWDYVVVTDPIQLHLGEANQQVITIPAESFLSGTDIANAYNQLPETFAVGSIKVHIYEKTRDVTADEYAAYYAHFEAALPEKYAEEAG